MNLIFFEDDFRAFYQSWQGENFVMIDIDRFFPGNSILMICTTAVRKNFTTE